jgi:hypothetical protein
METIEIKVCVDKQAAARAGALKYGEAAFTPTAEQWSAITPEERVWLAAGCFGTSIPDYGDPYGDERTLNLKAAGVVTWDSVVSAMRARMAEQTAARAKQVADREAAVQEWLALPDDEVIDNYRRYWQVSVPSRLNDHPAVKARCATLQPEANRRNDADKERREAAKAEEDTEKAAKEAAKEAKRAAAEASFKAHALTTGGVLARAASEDYDVTRAVTDAVVGDMTRALDEAGLSYVILRMGTKAWDRASWEDRPSPSARAFEVQDTCTGIVAKLAHPEGMDVDVSRVERVKSSRDEDAYTAIRITLWGPCMTQHDVIVAAEGDVDGDGGEQDDDTEE